MRLWGCRKAFTIVELMVVIGVIGVLTAIAIPLYVNLRDTTWKNACIANLKQIDLAVERWSMNKVVNEGVDLTPYEDEIYAYIFGERPTCPAGGTYILTKLSQHPQVRCNVVGHQLP